MLFIGPAVHDKHYLRRILLPAKLLEISFQGRYLFTGLPSEYFRCGVYDVDTANIIIANVNF